MIKNFMVPFYFPIRCILHRIISQFKKRLFKYFVVKILNNVLYNAINHKTLQKLPVIKKKL